MVSTDLYAVNVVFDDGNYWLLYISSVSLSGVLSHLPPDKKVKEVNIQVIKLNYETKHSSFVSRVVTTGDMLKSIYGDNYGEV